VVELLSEKCVVILSGGTDSSTVAYWAKDRGYEVHAVTFDYGQLAKVEILHAAKITEKLGIEHLIIDLSELKTIYEGVTSLVDESIPLTSEFTEPIIVPFRNGVFIAVAVAYAASTGSNHIFYGAHASDENSYPDCRKEFYKAFEKAAQLGTELPMLIDAPFGEQPKTELLKKGIELGVPYELTWSCYTEGPTHCGECESCNNRKKAFTESGITDKTKYLK
jgi:7-cyano-7-deazaguanine synthase